jgi:hypothetical protein
MSIHVPLSDFVKMVDHHLQRELHTSLQDFPNIWAEDYYKEDMTVKKAKEACRKIQEDCLSSTDG